MNRPGMRAAVLGLALACSTAEAARVQYDRTEAPRTCVARVTPTVYQGAVTLVFRTDGRTLDVELGDTPSNRAARDGRVTLVAGDTRVAFQPQTLPSLPAFASTRPGKVMQGTDPVHITVQPADGEIRTARFDKIDLVTILRTLARRCAVGPDLALQRQQEAALALEPRDIQLLNQILLSDAGSSLLPAQAATRFDARARRLIGAFSVKATGARRQYLDQGLMDAILARGGFRVGPVYENARRFADGVAPVKQFGRWGVIDNAMRWVKRPAYDRIPSSFSGHVPVEKDGRWGVMDTTGRVTNPITYDRVLTCRERRCPFRQGERWGFLDPTGGIAIRAKYQRVRGFRNGKAAVRDERGWGVIDKTGRSTGRITWVESLYSPAEQAMLFQASDKRWGFLRADGRLMIDARFDGADSFSDGLAPVRQGDWWGFINKTGRTVIRLQYREVTQFSEGLAAAKATTGLWGYIDRTGRWVIAPKFLGAFQFRDGIAVVRVSNPLKPSSTDRADLLRGFIDKGGTWIIDPIFEDVWRFNEGLAPVKVLGRWGYLDLALIKARR